MTADQVLELRKLLRELRANLMFAKEELDNLPLDSKAYSMYLTAIVKPAQLRVDALAELVGEKS